MKCQHCQADCQDDFCSPRCRVLYRKAHAGFSIEAISTQAEIQRKALSKEIERNKVVPAKPNDSITGNALIDHRIREAIASTKFGVEKIDENELRVRLFGSKDPLFCSTGIKGYNEFQLENERPWHCTTVVRLAELLTRWGHDAVKWIKGEAKGVGYVPSLVSVEIP